MTLSRFSLPRWHAAHRFTGAFGTIGKPILLEISLWLPLDRHPPGLAELNGEGEVTGDRRAGLKRPARYPVVKEKIASVEDCPKVEILPV